ncbi:hypothetical protein T4D_16655 [Trichinella pseudospiralis]|uniref:Uncharacterized protein n=1 Tax=Trichinella pseudospiralis TaxID=6337 RepID=A0A0V1F3G5_TRIPS|nr:hypothetical protein T4D_14544 [Trichinella pseudospiralis]KRY80491.1 hypothetical protein T4D_14595 [Trichinella pseudospiralis]KRY80551.1 hypothetical protein T4D_15674 [Trichinella pseudospiralis]KRY81089.1 hypothetical protein T4D_16655 [Trichinella pseudospiralis]
MINIIIKICGNFESVVSVAFVHNCDKCSSADVSCGKIPKLIRNKKFKIGQVEIKTLFILKLMHFNQHNNQTDRNYSYGVAILK